MTLFSDLPTKMAAEIPLRCRSEAKLRGATHVVAPRQCWLMNESIIQTKYTKKKNVCVYIYIYIFICIHKTVEQIILIDIIVLYTTIISVTLSGTRYIEGIYIYI